MNDYLDKLLILKLNKNDKRLKKAHVAWDDNETSPSSNEEQANTAFIASHILMMNKTGLVI